MNAIELAVGVALVLVLLGVALYFGWRQRQTSNLLRADIGISPIERTFLQGQVRRRTVSCVLLALFALVLGGWFFIEGDFDQLGPSAVAAADEAAKKELKESLWFYTAYWIGALLLLMIIVALAAADFLATARYGLKRKRRLLDDHHALLALEAARLRRKRDEM